MLKNNKMRRLNLVGLLFIAVICAVFVTGCNRAGKNVERIAAAEVAKPETLVVSTTPVTTKQLAHYLQVTGSFVAFESSDVAPATSGIVAATPVNAGDFVKQGDILARLDDRDARMRLQQASATEQQALAAVRQAQEKIGIGTDHDFNATLVPEVLAARSNYESAQAQENLAVANANRYASLIETGVIAHSTYDQAQAEAATARAQAKSALQQYEAAKNNARQNNQGVATNQAALEGARAQVAIANKAVNDTVIRAPFSGYISDRPTAVGEYVTTASKIAIIQKTNPIKLALQIPEGDAGAVKIGMSVTASVAAYPQRQFDGKITAVVPSVDPTSRALNVIVQIDNPENLLHPGMFATARVVQPGGQEGLFVPRTAVISDTNTNSAQIYVLDGDKARVRVIQLGEQDQDNVRVATGLSHNDIVITNHLDKLYDGAIVQR